MAPILTPKVFNIPFSGGAAMIVVAVKYTLSERAGKSVCVSQLNADGTTVDWEHGDLSLSIAVSDSIMTVKLFMPAGYVVTDCRCCAIPGDPFA